MNEETSKPTSKPTIWRFTRNNRDLGCGAGAKADDGWQDLRIARPDLPKKIPSDVRIFVEWYPDKP